MGFGFQAWDEKMNAYEFERVVVLGHEALTHAGRKHFFFGLICFIFFIIFSDVCMSTIIPHISPKKNTISYGPDLFLMVGDLLRFPTLEAAQVIYVTRLFWC